MINPKYIKLIERVKEKYPELRELVEDLKRKLIKNQKQVDPDIQEIVNKNFYELL